MTTLNREQKIAVETTRGRVLVLAGAGSGKTSVLINRCVHLIKKEGVAPSKILGLTFTNKAASEMRERIKKAIGKELAEEILLSTFHSFCLFILKEEIHHLGYSKGFTIYDEKDTLRAMQGLDQPEETPPLEEETKEPEEKDPEAPTPEQKALVDEEIQNCLKAYNAVNFDGLLSLTVKLFKNFPHVLQKYQDRFSYVMIDEYQDTNQIQFELAELLVKSHNNIFVVGDDDQSIYSWRGSNVAHILNFPHKTLVKLEQNYRSTKPILDVANTLIQNNKERHNKLLWSETTHGDQVHVFHAPTEKDEAAAVAERIAFLKQSKNLKWSDFAILYRSNNLSRPFEVALMQKSYREKDQFLRGIPYRVIQGTEFYERAEVKDLLAYLKVIVNPLDQAALLRILNYPKRSISTNTIATLREHQQARGTTLWHLLHHAKELNLTTHGIKGIESFLSLIKEAQERFDTTPLKEALLWLIDTLELKRVIEEEVKSEKARAYKWENIQTFISMIDSYESKNPNLDEFVSTTLLDQNKHGHQGKYQDRVNLLTFHSAKGLEFEVCFLVGLEERLLPHERSLAEGGLEEERRLFYVALTRAKKYLTLSMAQKRTSHGKEKKTNPSRFLFELPKDLLTIESWDRPSSFLY